MVRNFIIATAALLLVGGTAPLFAKEDSLIELPIQLQGMDFEKCAGALEEVIKALDGAGGLKMDEDTMKGSLSFDLTKIDAAKLMEALNKTGCISESGK